MNPGTINRITYDADNCGPELLADLRLIHFLLQNHSELSITYRVKNTPFAVSDVTLRDIEKSLSVLESSGEPALRPLATELRTFFREGRWVVSAHPFSVTGESYHKMPLEWKLELAKSDLWVLKGDAHYRRLVDNRLWGPLAPAFCAIPPGSPPVLVLRTAKSEIMPGVDPAIVTQLAVDDSLWYRKGVGGMIQLIRGV
jgi:hypothetical protein